MKFAYVGLKDVERAFIEDTGIAWTPGMVDSVDPEIGQKMLKHVDVWKLVAEDAVVKGDGKTLADAGKPADDGSSLPAWVKEGIELGLSDDQLESIAKAGGPETDAGKVLYKTTLLAVATSRGLKLHPKTGVAKLIEALKAAKK